MDRATLHRRQSNARPEKRTATWGTGRATRHGVTRTEKFTGMPIWAHEQGGKIRATLAKWRSFTWVIFAINAILVVWVASTVSAISHGCVDEIGQALKACH